MKHTIVLTLRLLLLVIALYAVSNALKELLLREDRLISVVLLVGSNMLIATICWSVGCWRVGVRSTDQHGPPGRS
jgi:hypothetical protein